MAATTTSGRPLAPPPPRAADATAVRRRLLRLVDTDGGLSPAVARVALGAVMFPHGAQKLFGWFGGPGYGPTLGDFSNTLSVPAPLAALAASTEFAAAILLLVGLFSRLAALGIAAIMLGAIALAHAPHGFFMNGAGNQGGEGVECHLLALALALVVAFAGGGRASVDQVLELRLRQRLAGASGGAVGRFGARGP